jgi:hypothetical protein
MIIYYYIVNLFNFPEIAYRLQKYESRNEIYFIYSSYSFTLKMEAVRSSRT